MLAASACSIEFLAADTATSADDTSSPTDTMAIVSTVENSASPRTIDVHAHALSPRLVELTAGHLSRLGPPNPHNEYLMQTRYKTPFESIDARLETMALQGIDMQVVSHMPNFGYWADRQVSEQ